MSHEHEPVPLDPREPADVVVVGAGLAGLAAAATAARAGARVVVVDSRSPGGRARTDVLDGFAFNQGPHALYLSAPGSRVLRDLDAVPTGAKPPTSGAGAAIGGRVVALPTGAWSLLRTP